MIINRRDVVEVIFGFDTKDYHPVIVLSPEDINSIENKFLGMMITSSPYFDRNNDYSFPLNDSMFMKPLTKSNSKARLHLISITDVKSMTRSKINEMKIDAFKDLIHALNTKIFGV